MRGGKQGLCHRAWGFHIFLPRHEPEANPASLNHKLKSFRTSRWFMRRGATPRKQAPP
jgi:hypothetical protein